MNDQLELDDGRSDRLELSAAYWLMMRPAGAQPTPAARAVERALARAYLRRRGYSVTSLRVMDGVR